MDSPIDQRFGCARYYVIHNTETKAWETYSSRRNLETLPPHDSDIQAAQAIIHLKVTTLITGHCRPKALRALIEGNIDVYQNTAGTVKEAINAYFAGNLIKSCIPNVEAPCSNSWLFKGARIST